MSTDITIFVNPTQWIELDISGIEFITFLGKDGKSYIAISALGSPDNFARICRASFKDCYVEVFKRENLSAREVFNEWKNLSKKTKISILIFMKTAERAAGEYAVYFDENRTKDYPNGCVRFNECKRNAFLA
ncbi:MAG: hypothetical protein FWD66_11605, partial [Paludibacter sp.]|nr:hypothetical protein [Paludibacter sp.]